MQSRYLYASVTATGQLFFDMPSNSTIKGCQFAFNNPVAAAGDLLEVEVSLASTNQTAVTDALNVVAIASVGVSSTAGATTCNSVYMPADMPVKAGERVYVNYTETGTSTWKLRVLVYFT